MSSLLETINSPEDVRGVPRALLPQLAAEIRQLIIETVATNSGHLASNLGTVELTLALCRCFDLKSDAVIWDVGHQAYTYKIVTGRRESFATLRQPGGLSGFPNRNESPYDHFTTGHAGTSLSTALGLALARKASGEKGRTVVVIGDGAIASGMPFEALNHIGHLEASVVVILNDNRMSISGTIGAMAKHLNRLRTARVYTGAKREVHQALRRLPRLGPRVEHALEVFKESLKFGFVREHLFTDLGLNYFGPVDGHDFGTLIETIDEIKALEGPVILHVVTEKGRGFGPATRDPTAFHSASPSTFHNGGGAVREKVNGGEERLVRSYTDAFAQALADLAAEDERIVAVTAAMCTGCGLTAFEKTYPDRLIDCGICEQHAVGLTAGLAVGGLRPVLAIYSTFLQRAYDQIFQEIVLQGGPVVIAIDRAGVVGSDGPTHHGVFDIAYLRHLPDLILMAPRDGDELAAMLRWALAQPTPVAIRYPRDDLPALEVPLAPPITLGRSETLVEGTDATVLAYGATVAAAVEAARLLADRHGLSVAVVNGRFAKPVDAAAVRAGLEQTRLLLTVEDHALAGGFGSAVLELAVERGWDTSTIARLGVPDRLVTHAPRRQLLADLGLDAAGIVRAVRSALENTTVGRPAHAARGQVP